MNDKNGKSYNKLVYLFNKILKKINAGLILYKEHLERSDITSSTTAAKNGKKQQQQQN